MLTRFTCNSTNKGMTGFFNAIIATATASAGSTPSTPTGCNTFEVLGNTVAGGWTKIAPSGNVTSTTQTVTLCAASPKAFTDGTKKLVKFYAASACSFEECFLNGTPSNLSNSTPSSSLLAEVTMEISIPVFTLCLSTLISGKIL